MMTIIVVFLPTIFENIKKIVTPIALKNSGNTIYKHTWLKSPATTKIETLIIAGLWPEFLIKICCIDKIYMLKKKEYQSKKE